VQLIPFLRTFTGKDADRQSGLTLKRELPGIYA